jgi:hypothetical protein
LPSCLWCPQLCAAFHQFSPTSYGRGVPWPWLYVAWTTAVFVFFPQVGLRTALRHWEAMADRSEVPRSVRCLVSSYPFRSWIGPSDRCWDPLVQRTDSSPRPCPGNAANC